jgi:chitinase
LYLFYLLFYASNNDKIEYYKMTHVCLSFANPDAYGNLSFAKNADPAPVIKNARAAGVGVFLSLAGGGLEPAWQRSWRKLQQPYFRRDFIQKIVDYVLIHRMQGVDVDIEWDEVGANYSDFVIELGSALRFHNLKMTAALPGIHRYPHITDAALQAFDWINVMAYDLTGPWNPSRVGQHAPYSLAVESIDYWLGQDVPANKLNLGLPFYGFDFSNRKKVHSASFGDLTKRNVSFANLDQVGKTYYNGIPTIKAKTTLAMEQTGGVMIWEIGQDCFNGNSLLDVIFKEKLVNLKEEALVEITIEKIEIQEPFPAEIMPESQPIDGQLTKYDTWEVMPAEGRFVFVDVKGRALFSKKVESNHTLKINTGFLLNGLQFFEIVEEGQPEPQQELNN